MELWENRNFLDDILDLVFGIFNVNDFDSYSLSGTFVDTVRALLARPIFEPRLENGLLPLVNFAKTTTTY